MKYRRNVGATVSVARGRRAIGDDRPYGGMTGKRIGPSHLAGEGAALDKSTTPCLSHTPSFLRKQESSLSGFPTAAWIPAGAGMTGKNQGHHIWPWKG
jgi:hypothetical protein